jgi:hypothetical protein
MSKVDDYIEALDDNRRAIAEKLRDLLLAHVPGIEEKFSFKVPCSFHVRFYDKRSEYSDRG